MLYAVTRGRSLTVLIVAFVSVLSAGVAGAQGRVDTMPDTWVATDALGRQLPGFAECGPPRADRTVGMFYFLWLGAHTKGGPYDVSKILAAHPEAMGDPAHPAWGPHGANHHWAESIFGYYDTKDPFVLAKHAQMLADAGVDVVIFDVTNQFIYRDEFRALLEAFARVRRLGGTTPQVAFLCPFWTPAKVVRRLHEELYEPGLHEELWFRWEGKPLILADPEKLGITREYDARQQAARVMPGQTLGQSFTSNTPLSDVEVRVPTWQASDSAVVLTLKQDGPDGAVLCSRRHAAISDNAWIGVQPSEPLPPGAYSLELSQPEGSVGWWSQEEDAVPGGQAWVDGRPVGGDRAVKLVEHDEVIERMRAFFTFRRPQPDYFRGPTGPDMWSWLEVFPQHVFRNARGEKEQMSVGVAQNAVGSRLGSMSEPGARGRSFHGGETDRRPGAIDLGLNFAEQFERALAKDPRFIFVTGWNEWIATRFDEFNGIRQPVMFVDQFDQEHSRDIEPMQGGHGDSYYWQLVGFVRRFKGVRPRPTAGPPKTIDVQGGFAQWDDVLPTFRDDAGDTLHRDWPGYDSHTRYLNDTGRNDFVEAKVARDEQLLSFFVRTREPITAPAGSTWMLLLIDTDGSRDTGWEGYDLLVNRARRGDGTCTVERCTGGWSWEAIAEATLVVEGDRLQLSMPRGPLGLSDGPLRLDFTWADNIREGDIMSFFTDGDVAPNGRFNYRFEEAHGEPPFPSDLRKNGDSRP